MNILCSRADKLLFTMLVLSSIFFRLELKAKENNIHQSLIDNLFWNQPYEIAYFHKLIDRKHKKPKLLTPNLGAVSELYSSKKKEPTKTEANSWLKSQDFVFEENKGQITEGNGNLRGDVHFIGKGRGMNVFLTEKGITYVFQKIPQNTKGQDLERLAEEEPISSDIELYRMDMELVGANLNGEIIKENAKESYANYYTEHAPDGILNVGAYKKLTYKEVYPNIDWVIYSGKEGTARSKKGFKYEFVVHPGGNPEEIRMEYQGADAIEIEQGRLKVNTSFGEIVEEEPYTFQEGKFNRNTIQSSYKKEGKTISFNVEGYDTSKELVVDPAISWSTLYGGTYPDAAKSITIDSFGNIFVAAVAATSSFPTFNPGGGAYHMGGINAAGLAILKFSNTGVRLWATYYGPTGMTTGSEVDHGITVDNNDQVYVVGNATTGFPTQNLAGAYNQSCGVGSSFLIKFSNNGVRLWATCFGTNNTLIPSVATDSNGNVIVVGHTLAITIQNLPGAYNQSTIGGNGDYFIAKFNNVGALVWSTYLGGSDDERFPRVATDASDNILVAGWIHPFGGGSQYSRLYKFNSSGALQWSKTISGNSNMKLKAIEADISGNVFVVGVGSQTNLTTVDPGGGAYFQNSQGGSGDMVIQKYSASGTLLWSTYYGGTAAETANHINIDGSGNISIVGTTFSAGFPTMTKTGCYNQSSFAGGYDVIIVEFSSTLQLQWATHFGGTDQERGYDIINDTGNNLFVVGHTQGFPSVVPLYNPGGGAYFQNADGLQHIFITKFGSSPLLPTELTRFTANWNDKAQTEAMIEWQTETETNNEYFYIERSTDAIHFEDVARIDGALNSTKTINYSYIDDGLFEEKSIFYRLRQVDIDGTTTYSNIEVLNKEEGIDIITLYPNPNFGDFKYLVSSSVDSEATITIVDNIGKVVKQETIEIEKGVNKKTISANELGEGNYHIKIQTKEGNYQASSQFVMSSR